MVYLTSQHPIYSYITTFEFQLQLSRGDPPIFSCDHSAWWHDLWLMIKIALFQPRRISDSVWRGYLKISISRNLAEVSRSGGEPTLSPSEPTSQPYCQAHISLPTPAIICVVIFGDDQMHISTGLVANRCRVLWTTILFHIRKVGN